MTGKSGYGINDPMSKANQLRSRLSRPVVLVGLMGSGKTRLGRMLARALRVGFIDTDDVVIQQAGADIPTIFETQGEPVFRDMEAAAIRDLLGGGDRRVQVISTGGGAPMRPENAALIFGDTVSIWTRADFPVLLERIGRSNDRPLLRNADPEKTLRDMAEIRYPVYRQADIVIDTDCGSIDDILSRTLARIEEILTS